jgi:uncharacterized DUF497 family protein
MELEWDETKRRANLAKHGFDFDDLSDFDWDSAKVTVDDRIDYQEDRFVAFGPFRGQICSVVFTRRAKRVRVISFRAANRKEIKQHGF